MKAGRAFSTSNIFPFLILQSDSSYVKQRLKVACIIQGTSEIIWKDILKILHTAETQMFFCTMYRKLSSNIMLRKLNTEIGKRLYLIKREILLAQIKGLS